MKNLLLIIAVHISLMCFGQKTQSLTSKVPTKSTTVTTSGGSTATFAGSYVYSPSGFKTITVIGPKGRRFKKGTYTNDGKICICAGSDGYGHYAIAPGTEIIADDAAPKGAGISALFIPISVKYIGANNAHVVRSTDLEIDQENTGDDD